MTTTITEDNLVEFVKLLLEVSGVYRVLEDRTILKVDDNSLMSFRTSSKSNAPVRIFKEGDPIEGYAYLQPFKEISSNTQARNWFYSTICLNVSVTLKLLLLEVVELAVSKTSTDPEQLNTINLIFDKVDKTTINEIKRLAPMEIVSIYYSRKEKVAKLQAKFIDEEVREKHSNIRKKTWDVIEILIAHFLGFDNYEVVDEDLISYKSETLNIPEIESKLNIVVSTLERLSTYATIFMDKQISVEALQRHCMLLPTYHKMQLYLNADNTYPDKPQQQQQIPINPLQQQYPGLPNPLANLTKDTSPKSNKAPSLAAVVTEDTQLPLPQQLPLHNPIMQQQLPVPQQFMQQQYTYGQPVQQYGGVWGQQYYQPYQQMPSSAWHNTGGFPQQQFVQSFGQQPMHQQGFQPVPVTNIYNGEPVLR